MANKVSIFIKNTVGKECEARHLGLSVEEIKEYTALEQAVKYWSSVVSSTNNGETRGKLDRAIGKVIALEEKYNIKN